jgi:hypothetical protein
MDIVYGSFNDFEITFLPIKTAEYYAKLHTAHQNGITFAELCDQLPEFFDLIMDYKCNYFYQFGLPSCEGISCQKFYLKLFKKLYDEFGSSNRIGMVKVDREFKSLIDFSDYYQNELDLEERLPLSADKFNEESVPFETLMEIINYEPRMDWAPEDIYNKLGFEYESIHDGDFTVFLKENESEILQAFKDAGYNCIRNEKLIAQAFGQ